MSVEGSLPATLDGSAHVHLARRALSDVKRHLQTSALKLVGYLVAAYVVLKLIRTLKQALRSLEHGSWEASIGTIGGIAGMLIVYGVAHNPAIAAVLLHQAIGLLVPLTGGGISYAILRRRVRPIISAANSPGRADQDPPRLADRD